MDNRKNIENRIIQIISFIDKEKQLKGIIGILKLFPFEELVEILKFLENGNYEIIYKLVDKKIKEYILVKKEIQNIKIKNKLKKIKEIEKKEEKEEDLNKLFDF